MNTKSASLVLGIGMNVLASSAMALQVVPGLHGFGTDTPAGRGGKVYKVTNLNSSGSGSLAACTGASGPRVCVFEVSGEIKLNDKFQVDNPYLTIAGQTAPSPGITITGAPFQINASHVLMQHLRIRVGDRSGGYSAENRDGLIINGNKAGSISNVVIDHCSFSWSIDEMISLWNQTGKVTFNQNIFGEALNNSIHPKGAHGYGPILGQFASSKVTMRGNLFAHMRARNPLARAPSFIFVNNVIYNWGQQAAMLSNRSGLTTVNSIVGNVFLKGADSQGKPVRLMDGGSPFGSGSRVYLSDNLAPDYSFGDQWGLVDNMAGVNRNTVELSSRPDWPAGLNAKSTANNTVRDWVTDNAGARPADRDAVDQRIVSSTLAGTGRIIDCISGCSKNAGGWPTLAKNTRSLSVPSNPSGDDDGDGYTNLEEWLHSYASAVEVSQGVMAPPSPPSGIKIN